MRVMMSAFTSTKLDTSWTALHRDDDACKCRFIYGYWYMDMNLIKLIYPWSWSWVIHLDHWSLDRDNSTKGMFGLYSLTLIRAIFSIDVKSPPSRKSRSSSTPFGLFLFHSGPDSSGFSSDFLFLECCLMRPDSLVSSWQEASTWRRFNVLIFIFPGEKMSGEKETEGSLAGRQSALKSLWRSHSKCFKGG